MVQMLIVLWIAPKASSCIFFMGPANELGFYLSLKSEPQIHIKAVDLHQFTSTRCVRVFFCPNSEVAMPTPAQINEREQLKQDEGVRSKLYKDSEGKLTIGVGRNIEDVGLRPDEIDYLLDNDIEQATKDAEKYVGWEVFNNLSTDRQGVLINMSFNLGYSRLSGFKQLKAAIIAGNYSKAADEMLNSKWARQVGDRAQRLAIRMKG